MIDLRETIHLLQKDGVIMVSSQGVLARYGSNYDVATAKEG